MYLLDDDDNVFDIQEKDIICIEVSRPHISYRTKQGKFRAPRTIVEFMKIYSCFDFVLIDKKKMVNLQLADKFQGGFVHYGDLKYPVSRRNASLVKEKLDRLHHH